MLLVNGLPLVDLRVFFSFFFSLFFSSFVHILLLSSIHILLWLFSGPFPIFGSLDAFWISMLVCSYKILIFVLVLVPCSFVWSSHLIFIFFFCTKKFSFHISLPKFKLKMRPNKRHRSRNSLGISFFPSFERIRIPFPPLSIVECEFQFHFDLKIIFFCHVKSIQFQFFLTMNERITSQSHLDWNWFLSAMIPLSLSPTLLHFLSFRVFFLLSEGSKSNFKSFDRKKLFPFSSCIRKLNVLGSLGKYCIEKQ